jgi:hypothetical protein
MPSKSKPTDPRLLKVGGGPDTLRGGKPSGDGFISQRGSGWTADATDIDASCYKSTANMGVIPRPPTTPTTHWIEALEGPRSKGIS